MYLERREYLYFSVTFKTLSTSGPARGIETTISRSVVKHSTDWAYACCGKYKIPNQSSFWICFRSPEGSVPAHYAAAGGHLECLKWIHRKASKSISITVCCLRTDFELAKSSD